jgi:hypothetical protein
MRLLTVLFILTFLTGCETTKCFLGISTKEVEQARPGAVSKVFNYELNACYNKTEAALKAIGAYVYAKKAGMIACYNTYSDTTPVGIFFKEIDSNNTQIEISSPSSAVRDQIAEKLFLKLEEKPAAQKEELN